MPASLPSARNYLSRSLDAYLLLGIFDLCEFVHDFVEAVSPLLTVLEGAHSRTPPAQRQQKGCADERDPEIPRPPRARVVAAQVVTTAVFGVGRTQVVVTVICVDIMGQGGNGDENGQPSDLM